MRTVLGPAVPFSFLALLVIAVAAGSGRADQARVSPPKGFRSWTHVKSMAVEERDHGMYGFHNVYANARAIKGLRSRSRPQRYEAGATFVVSLFEVVRRDGMVQAGAKRRDVVQLKDPTATSTGGWRFAAFDAKGKPIPIDAASCFSCHAQARDSDHVLATFAE